MLKTADEVVGEAEAGRKVNLKGRRHKCNDQHLRRCNDRLRRRYSVRHRKCTDRSHKYKGRSLTYRGHNHRYSGRSRSSRVRNRTFLGNRVFPDRNRGSKNRNDASRDHSHISRSSSLELEGRIVRKGHHKVTRDRSISNCLLASLGDREAMEVLDRVRV